MKRLGCFVLAIALSICMVPSVFAQAQKYQIGADAALKIDWIYFTDSAISDANSQNGLYIGGEFYKELLFQGLYLGIEAGGSGASGTRNNGGISRRRPFDTCRLNSMPSTYMPSALVSTWILVVVYPPITWMLSKNGLSQVFLPMLLIIIGSLVDSSSRS